MRELGNLAARLRRLPRRHALVTLALVVMLGVVGVTVLGGQATQRAEIPPAPELAGRWTLAVLSSELASGTIGLIDIARNDAGNVILVAQRADQAFAVGLTVSIEDAVASIASLGYADLLSPRARGLLGNGAAAADPLRNLVTLGFIGILVVLAVLLFVQMRSSGALRGGRSARFATIMPTTAVAATGRRGDAGVASNAPVAQELDRAVRCCRLRGGQAGARRGDRVPARPGPFPHAGSPPATRHPAVRPARHG
jgi:hypothetical protein